MRGNVSKASAAEAGRKASEALAEAVKKIEYKGEVLTYADLPAAPSKGDTYKVRNKINLPDKAYYQAIGGNWSLGENTVVVYNDDDTAINDIAKMYLWPIYGEGMYDIVKSTPIDEDVTPVTFALSVQNGTDPDTWEATWSAPYTVAVNHVKNGYDSVLGAYRTAFSGTIIIPSGGEAYTGEYAFRLRWAGLSGMIPDFDFAGISYVVPSFPAGTFCSFDGSDWIVFSADDLATIQDLAGKANATHNHAASDIASGVLGVAKGGTGLSSFSTNRIVYASSTAQLKQIPFPSGGASVLTQGVSGQPYWTLLSDVGRYKKIGFTNDCDYIVSGQSGGGAAFEAAILAANDGDVILVCDGKYTGASQVVVNKNLTFVGAGDAVIDFPFKTDGGARVDEQTWEFTNTGTVVVNLINLSFTKNVSHNSAQSGMLDTTFSDTLNAFGCRFNITKQSNVSLSARGTLENCYVYGTLAGGDYYDNYVTRVFHSIFEDFGFSAEGLWMFDGCRLVIGAGTVSPPPCSYDGNTASFTGCEIVNTTGAVKELGVDSTYGFSFTRCALYGKKFAYPSGESSGITATNCVYVEQDGTALV